MSSIAPLSASNPLAPLKNRKPHYEKFIRNPQLIRCKLLKEFQYARAQQKELAKRIQPPFPFASDKSKQPIKTETFKVGPYTAHAASCQGRRPTMEDAHIAQILRVHNQKIPFFGVFDGHGGSAASLFLKQNLPAYLTHYLEQFGLTDAGIWNALKHALVELDHDFTDSSGSTAIIALIAENHLWIANLGDSRALLSTPKTAIQLSEDAKPDAPRYLRSIEKRGGFVLSINGCQRILGGLAVGRAFGDHKFALSPPNHCVVPHAPKITKHPIPKDATLLLACDGLFDVATTDQASKAIQQSCTAANLVAKAYNANSDDNITALLVPLTVSP